MDKPQEIMRSIFVFAMYLLPAAFLIWRAETYQDSYGHQLLLARVMCIILAVMIAMVGLTRLLEGLDSGTSAD